MLARSSLYGPVLLATGCAVWYVIFYGAMPFMEVVVFSLLIVPALAWSWSWPWWYGLHRDLAAYGRRHGYEIFKVPWACVVPLFSALIAVLMLIANENFYSSSPIVTSDAFVGIYAALALIGIFGSPVGIYRTACKMWRLRCPTTPQRVKVAGLRATGMYLLPPLVFLYFQHSLSRILAEGTTTTPRQHPSAELPRRLLKKPGRRKLWK